MLTLAQAVAVQARYPHQLHAIEREAFDGTLHDRESGTRIIPATLREAIAWINAGEWDCDGTNPRSTRLAAWRRPANR